MRIAAARRWVTATCHLCLVWAGWAGFVLGAVPATAQEPLPAAQAVIVVRGASGADEFARDFEEAAQHWRQLAQQAGAGFQLIGEGSDQGSGSSDRDQLAAALGTLVAGESDAPLWLVLIGHGTFDNNAAKFNLRGPDVSAQELAEWLAPARRPLIVANGSSSSGPFLDALKGPNRVVITATRSGAEQNYARFGKFLAETIGDVTADLDKDERVSLLEAYLAAAKRTAEFYEGEGRLATEHALLDDNGDGLGTPGDWFRGIRPTRAARDGAALDGSFAHRFHLLPAGPARQESPEVAAERSRLEGAIEALRVEKPNLATAEYYARLEELLIALARLGER